MIDAHAQRSDFDYHHVYRRPLSDGFTEWLGTVIACVVVFMNAPCIQAYGIEDGELG